MQQASQSISFINAVFIGIVVLSISGLGCQDPDDGSVINIPKNNGDSLSNPLPIVNKDTIPDSIKFSSIKGCDGQLYLNPFVSPYVLPFSVGITYRTGLTNCSASYHGPGQPDQYAYDFNMPEDSPFMASRAGTVVKVVNDKPSSGGGGAGNYLIIDHKDGTFGLYYHSPENGIIVEPGDVVKQGDMLGKTGKSGLAGYPHLHFIVVKGNPTYPYNGIPISFSNAEPLDVPLKGSTFYKAILY